MSTPFERGKIDGQWTDEQIKRCGFNSARECLAHQERLYQEKKANLPSLRAQNPAFAAQHAESLEGLITGTRESLHGRQ